MHLLQLYLVVSAALFFLGSGIALGPIEHFGKDRLPKPYRRSFLKKLAVVGGIELVALAVFMIYAWFSFDPIDDQVYGRLMLMVLQHLLVAGLIQCVAWPAIRWLLAREPKLPTIRRSALVR